MKNKCFVICIMFLLSFSITKAQTVLAAGDIAITGFNADNPDRFSFVILTEITDTTVINFTDNGWQNSEGDFRDNEGTVTWTATSDLTCGTEILIENVGGNLFSANVGTAISTNNGFALSLVGDQILVYQGPDVMPTFIYAINFSALNWIDNDSPNGSDLPPGLTDGLDAVDVGNFEDGSYDCSVTNNPALVLAAISTNTNWTLSNVIIPIGGCYYTCCVSTTTWNGVALGWDNGLPTTTSEAIINELYDTGVSGSFEACNLTVNAIAGNTLAIQNGDFVQVVNDITIDGTVFLASEASLVQVNDMSTVTLAGTGIGRVQKTTTPIDDFTDYTYWSSPFTNETIATAMMDVPASRIFTYDAANFEDIAPADGFDDNSDDWAIATGVMIPGRGYAAFAQENLLALPQLQTYNFEGQFNNGAVTLPISVSAVAADPNWNFLGNPYPSGISADDFFAANPDLNGTMYFWAHNTTANDTNPGNEALNFSVDDYASYNTLGGTAAISGGTAPTGIIASGQGFFIEALNAGTVTFNNAMRVTTGNDDFFRTTDRIWLNFENDYGAFSQILIGFDENATNGVDRLYDGKRLDAGSYISFFSLMENDEEHYAIQGREALTEEEIIPLGIKNLVEGESQYKISLDNVEGVLETSEILLVDNLLDITHDLNSGEYRFNSNQGEYKARFELVLQSNIPNALVEEALVIINNQDDSLSFTTTNNSVIGNIQIFDILGRQLFNNDFSEEVAPHSIKFNELRQTLFIVKATLANGKVLTKKVLR